jgi:AraC-like DNA-binding protein
MRLGPGLHLHPMPEISFQLVGVASFRFLNQGMKLLPGECLVIPRGLAHDESVQTPNRFLNLVIGFSQEGIYIHFSDHKSGHRPSILLANIFDMPTLKLAEYFEDGAMASLRKTASAKALTRGLLTAGFAGLQEVLAGNQVDKVVEHSRLIQCRMLVLNKLSDPSLSVLNLAKELDCSAEYLSRFFHSESGVTLSRYITDVRLNNAKELLERSMLSVKEIAWASGYSEAGYFIRVFRKTFGSTPLQYRASVLAVVSKK